MSTVRNTENPLAILTYIELFRTLLEYPLLHYLNNWTICNGWNTSWRQKSIQEKKELVGKLFVSQISACCSDEYITVFASLFLCELGDQSDVLSSRHCVGCRMTWPASFNRSHLKCKYSSEFRSIHTKMGRHAVALWVPVYILCYRIILLIDFRQDESRQKLFGKLYQ